MKKRTNHRKNMQLKTAISIPLCEMEDENLLKSTEGDPCSDCTELKGEWHCTMNCYPCRVNKRVFW